MNNNKMKKPKPLKDKGFREVKKVLAHSDSFAGAMANAGRKINTTTGKIIFYDKDVKSAVEWLKWELVEFEFKPRVQLQLEGLIDKAFEDVTQKETKK